MKTASNEEYYVTFKCIFALSDILKYDLKKDSIFGLVSKLQEPGNIP